MMRGVPHEASQWRRDFRRTECGGSIDSAGLDVMERDGTDERERERHTHTHTTEC